MVPCEHISLNEEGGTSSVYLARVGRGEQDPPIVQGVHRLHPKGRTEVVVAPPFMEAELAISDITWEIGFSNGSRGSRGSVARLKGVAPPS